jgi:hypothetical protein
MTSDLPSRGGTFVLIGASIAHAPDGPTHVTLVPMAPEEPQIHGTIEQLVAEEHELWDRESAGNATGDDRRRLEAVRVSLDQCWDLLRQRRARRDAGQDPEQAELRRSEVVERYEQ